MILGGRRAAACRWAVLDQARRQATAIGFGDAGCASLVVRISPGRSAVLSLAEYRPDGTWIFRTIERIIDRPLRPHLMTLDLAEEFGRIPNAQVRPPKHAENSAIASLVSYLACEGTKWLEQEELEPVMPAVASDG
jgi:hypothetical protein